MARSTTSAQAGRLGGISSRRALSKESALVMVCVREARKLFRAHYTTCFWWARPDVAIGLDQVAWVADGLRRFGGRDAWRVAARLEQLLRLSRP